MRAIRETQLVTGFLYDEPLPLPSPVTHCGEATAVPGHALPWHDHPGFELHYLVRGTYSWDIEGRCCVQGPGETFVVHPGQRHRTYGIARHECHFLWIGLYLEKVSADGKRLAGRLRKERLFGLGQCPEIEPVMRGVVMQVVSPRNRQAAVVQTYLDLLVALLHQQLDTMNGESPTTELYSYRVQKALAFMQTILDRRLSIEEIAAASGWSVTQLSECFRREVGETPVRHHLRLRLEAARSALGVPNSTVTRVAMDYGFASPQHFTTQFHRLFGVSPRRLTRRG